MKTHLKIKIMSLAAEARIIRREERRWPRLRDLAPEQVTAEHVRSKRTGHAPCWTVRATLADHRRGIIRSEARYSLLAYGFLRGRPYRVIERDARELPSEARIADLAARFGGGDKKALQAQVVEWLKAPAAEAPNRKAA